MRRNYLKVCVFSLFIYFFIFQTGVPDNYKHNWPNFRGPDRSSITQEADWNPEGLKELNIAWQKQIGQGFSSPAIKDEYLYITGNTDGVNTVWCLNYRDGREIWKYEYPGEPGPQPGPKSSPTIHEGFVYVIGQASDVLCLDAKTGTVKWHVNLASDYGVKLTDWGKCISSSPVIEDNLLLINGSSSGIALDIETGKKVWAGKSGVGGYATPVIFAHEGKKHAAIFGEKKLFVVKVKSGKIVASYPWITDYEVNAADPVVIGSKVFITSAYEKGCALLELKKNKLTPIWENKNLNSHFSPVLYFNDKLYGIHSEGYNTFGDIVSLDPKTGKQLWSAGDKNKKYSSFIIANHKFIIQSQNGGLTIAEENKNGLRRISSNSLPGGIYWTPPVLCRGIIYSRNAVRGVLYAIDVSK